MKRRGGSQKKSPEVRAHNPYRNLDPERLRRGLPELKKTLKALKEVGKVQPETLRAVITI